MTGGSLVTAAFIPELPDSRSRSTYYRLGFLRYTGSQREEQIELNMKLIRKP